MVYCFFSAQYPPTVGGVENHTLRLAEKVAEKGDKALVVTSALPGLPEYEVGENGVEVYRLPSLLLAKGRMPLLLPFGKTRKFWRALAQKGVQRAVIQTRLYPLSLAAAKFCKKHRIPAMVVEHGHAYTPSGNPAVNLCLKWYTNALLRLVYHACPHFYAVSKSAAQWLDEQGFPAKGVFPNAIAAEEVQKALQGPQRSFYTENQIPPDALTVCYAGRLVAQKGVENLARAVLGYQAAHPAAPIHLLVAGEGELAQTFLESKNPCIHFLGRLSFQDVIALFSQTDIVCLPTAMPEGLPSSVLEAGACGAFVLATGQGGITELVLGPQYGALVEDNRPETLQAALQKLAGEGGYRAGAACNLQRRVLEQFTFDALYEKLKKLPWEVEV